VAREHVVPLAGPPVAAASDAESVWIVAGGRLEAYDAGAHRRWEAGAPRDITALAAARDGMLAAAVETGIIAWIDGRSGEVVTRQSLGGDLTVTAGGGAAWAVDRRHERAWRVEPDGSRAGPVPLPGVARVAVDGERIWWTSRHDTLLRGDGHAVDLGRAAGAVAACAGSVWISAPGALLRVGAWSGELGRPLPAPGGTATHLDCADGMLAGGSAGGLFVLDPRIDADAQRLDVALEDELGFLLATRSHVWAIAAGRDRAHVVPVRPG
jgi:hypothetical protein